MNEPYFAEQTISPENVEHPDRIVPVTPNGDSYVTAESVEGESIHEEISADNSIIRPDEQMTNTTPNPIPYAVNPELPAPLISREAAERFRTRWSEIQGKFVDEPRSAVQQADELVAEVVEQLTTMFTGQHSLLEEQWKQGNEISTEELRNALQHYRSFFNRLVA